MTSSSKRTAWLVAVPLAMAVVVSVILAARAGQEKSGYTLNSKTAPIASSSAAPVPSLSAAFVSAVNSTDVQIAPATGPASVGEASAVSAALGALPPGSSALAAELVTLTNSQYPTGVLAWAIETIPAGGISAGSGGPAGTHQPSPPPRNFRVDFVDASTGAWLEGVAGYSADL